MKKIFFVIVISFGAMLNVQAQTIAVVKDSLSSAVEGREQNLITDKPEENKPKRSYYKGIVQYLVSKKKDSLLVKVEFQSGFPEEAERWKKVLMENLNADTPRKNKAKSGIYEVVVQFIVSKDGHVSEVIALTNAGYGMEEEVVRAFRKGPKWFPAPQNDNIVRPYRKSAITFSIPDEK
jgi:hypothetical protein